MNKIKQYIKILELCQIEQNFKGQSELFSDHVKLIQEGYIGSRFGQEEPYSFSSENTFRVYNIIITPKGAVFLVELKKLMYSESVRGQFFKFIQTPLWILFGASLNKISELINSLI